MCIIFTIILFILLLPVLLREKPPHPTQAQPGRKDKIVQEALEEIMWIENEKDTKRTDG